MSHTSDSVWVPQLVASACSTTSHRFKVETSPVTMLICGCWVVVALVIVAHSAGAAGVLLLLFLPLPLAPPDASAAAGLISAVAAIATVTSIFLLNIRAPPTQVDLYVGHNRPDRVATAMRPWS